MPRLAAQTAAEAWSHGGARRRCGRTRERHPAGVDVLGGELRECVSGRSPHRRSPSGKRCRWVGRPRSAVKSNFLQRQAPVGVHQVQLGAPVRAELREVDLVGVAEPDGNAVHVQLLRRGLGHAATLWPAGRQDGRHGPARDAAGRADARQVRCRDPRRSGTYEPKWDGFRCIVFRDGDEVELGSRNERPLTRYFPEVVEAVKAQLPERVRGRRRDRRRPRRPARLRGAAAADPPRGQSG